MHKYVKKTGNGITGFNFLRISNNYINYHSKETNNNNKVVFVIVKSLLLLLLNIYCLK